MNYMKLYIIRSGILRWFRTRSQNKIFAYALKRKSHLKEFAWARSKKLYCFEFAAKCWFEVYPYVMKLQIITCRKADVLKIENASLFMDQMVFWIDRVYSKFSVDFEKKYFFLIYQENINFVFRFWVSFWRWKVWLRNFSETQFSFRRGITISQIIESVFKTIIV